MDEVILPLIAGGLFTLVGLAILASAGKGIFDAVRGLSRSKCNARVVEVQRNLENRYRPVVEFTPKNGSLTRFTPSYWTKRQVHVGDEVKVAYDSADPQSADLAGAPGRQEPILSLLFAGAFFLAGGLLGLNVGLRRPGEQKVEKVSNAFIDAAEKGDVDTVRRMLAGDPKLVNAVKMSAFFTHGSRRAGNRSIIDRPLVAAAKELHPEIVQLLLDHGADANATIWMKRTALHEAGEHYTDDDASAKKRVAILEALIAHGANVNARDYRDQTPLHENAKDAKAVEVLLAHGADVHAVTRAGRTPLHAAVGDSDAARLLLDHGADIEARDRDGNTPLMDAVASFNPSTIELLVSRGANTKVRNGAGATLLHVAADTAAGPSLSRGLPALALLCSCGLRPEVRDNSGRTPLEIARAKFVAETNPEWKKRHGGVAQFLSSAGPCDRLAKRGRKASQHEFEFIGAETACAEEDAAGCAHVGWAYDTGEGVAIDRKRAAELYTKSCNAGYNYACGNLGILYENGEGVPEDESRAAALYGRACDGGEISPCYNLAKLYSSGRGVTKDAATALTLYRKACAGGEADACRQAR